MSREAENRQHSCEYLTSWMVDATALGRHQVIQEEKRKKSFQKNTPHYQAQELFSVMNRVILTCGCSSKSRWPRQRHLLCHPRGQTKSVIYVSIPILRLPLQKDYLLRVCYYAAYECSCEERYAQHHSPYYEAR